MINPVDLRPDHIKVVHEILSANLPYTVSVHVFGSRALWTWQKFIGFNVLFLARITDSY